MIILFILVKDYLLLKVGSITSLIENPYGVFWELKVES